MAQITIADMRYGMQADGGIRDDSRLSSRRLVNFDLIYGGEKPRLRVRPGYERWNAVVLPATARQLHAFVDMQGNQHLIARVNTSRWYDVQEAGAHTQISTFNAAIKKPIFQYGNRLMLGTNGTDSDDPGIIWTDHDSLDTGTPATSYRYGIKKEEAQPVTAITQGIGWNPPLYHIGPPFIINTNTSRKLAIPFTVATTITTSIMYIGMNRPAPAVSLDGEITVRIETDNAGDPSGTLVDDASVTDPVDMDNITELIAGIGNPTKFTFQASVEFTPGNVYWAVIAGNADYYANYYAAWYCHVWHGTNASPNYTYYTLAYNSGVAAWGSTGYDAYFWLGGVDFSKWYDYVTTYYNSTYQIESRESTKVRVKHTADQLWTTITLPTSPDPQVDKVRVYRREVDAADTYEDDITDEYKFVGEEDEGGTIIDTETTEGLGAILQTLDHYCLDDVNTEDDGYRTEAIVPIGGCMWKGRAWVFAADSNELAFSKILEENGATGLLGLSAPDFFPLSNTMTMPEAADIIDCHPLSNDQLLVFLSNETVYVIYGGNQALNPPVDFNVSPVADTHGLISMGAFIPSSSSVYYMSRDGIWSIAGMGLVIQSYESEMNASIIRDIETQYLRNTEMISFGNEIWALIDTDNDGEPDTILILSLEREVLPRGLYERSWKMYQYDVSLRDLTMLNTGDEFREVYAADADNAYILKLDVGTLDNGAAITAYIDSHDIISENQEMIDQIDLDALMANEADGYRPVYTWLLTDHTGRTVTGTMSPNNNEDVRGFRSGTRLKGPVSVRARVSQLSVEADELRSITLSHNGE